MIPTGLYVYGVVRDDHPCELSRLVGVTDLADVPRRVPVGSLAAVVGHAPPDLRATGRVLAAHRRVLAELHGQGSVLPMRFGVVVPDLATLRENLARCADRYHALLRDLSGRVELTVEVLPDEEQMLREVARDEPVVRRLAERDVNSYHGRLALGEAVACALRERQHADAHQILETLAPLAVRTAVGPQTTGTVLNAGFLVERADTEMFAGAVEALGRRMGSRVLLRCTGPQPPYSFVPDEPE
ncbi:MAG TPA: GvpL/GvpF family gas vesicle protein [Mycobacteriales bacterium]|nr:GvpL/GvpF family gas vesicle protein [Mycobacteriales bacterium]